MEAIVVIVTPVGVRGVALTGIAGGFLRLVGTGGAERRPEDEAEEGDVGVGGTLVKC